MDIIFIFVSPTKEEHHEESPIRDVYTQSANGL